MPAEVLKAAIRRVMEAAWTKGDINALDELYAPHVIQHQPPLPDIIGLVAYKQSIVDARAATRDGYTTIDEIIVEGNTVALRGTFQGTHTGTTPTYRVMPTGKWLVIPYCFMSHYEAGKCVEEWAYTDYLGALQQLGVVPLPAAPAS